MAEKKMIIDGVSCPFTTERNVLEVARNNGIDIPSLCYCENLSIYGGCRLCLVENDRGKMDAACSMQPRDGMVVNTHTKQVLDSRRTTLQLLMSSHRADCLTCDQSGRCKLQEYARRYHVDEHRFEPNTYCTEPMDLSSPSIVRDPSKCILCGLCVRTCAEIQNIGAVDFSGRGKKAHISADFGKTLKDTDCVGCGQCAAVCPTGAITIRNETEKFWSMLQDQTRKVVVQYAPSVRVGMAERFGLPANEPCTGKLVAALRRLGADVVYDTNLTADLTIMEESAEFLEKVKTGAKLPMFTSCCPGWIQHVENRHPHLMPQVSTCGSPMAMFGSLIRKQFAGENVYSVAIMPCTGKKFEAARPELEKDGERLIDLVITTSELCDMIEEAGINFAALPDEEPDAPLGDYTGAGVIFPLAVAAVGIFASIIATFFVRGKDDSNPHKALKMGSYVSAVIVAVLSVVLSYSFFGKIYYALAIIAGLIVGLVIGFVTEVYTSDDYKSVKRIAAQSETGSATTIISGVAVGMMSTWVPIVLICIGIYISYSVTGDLYGIALAAELIDSGKALETLERFIAVSNRAEANA